MLEEQKLYLYKDESAAKKAKEPELVLDLKLLRKVSKMGKQQDRPYCIGLTVGYDSYLIWVDQLEYANWGDAFLDSNPNVAVLE